MGLHLQLYQKIPQPEGFHSRRPGLGDDDQSVAAAGDAAKRSALLPGVPTVAETGQGLEGFEVLGWFALMAPADRVNLLADSWALVEAGRAEPQSYLELVEEIGRRAAALGRGQHS